MTIKMPKMNILDKFLAAMGKRRAVYIPENLASNHYGVVRARKESLIRTVLRSKNEDLPPGWYYLDSFKHL